MAVVLTAGMSTKSSIAKINDGTWLEEEMLDDTTWLLLDNPTVEIHGNHRGARLRLHLSDLVLDAIARVHTTKGFPHQRGGQMPTAS